MNESSRYRGRHIRSLRSVETKTSLKPDFKWQCSHSSLLHN